MSRLVQQLVLWLLIAVLPLQGVAAVIKANCGPRHHAVSVTESVDNALATQQLHRMHGHHALPDGHDHAHGNSDMAGFQDPADELRILATSADLQQPESGHHYASYCSACAACCTGAVAPPVSFSVLSFPDSVEVAAVSPVLSYLGFIPPSLDRPPKPFFA